jgi:cytochrome c553
MKQLSAILCVLAGAVLPLAAMGQSAVSAANSSAATGNAAAGQKIAQAGGPGGVTACMSCHGTVGQGTAGAGFPRLAGQSQYYLERQLNMFASGARNNSVMTPIAKSMSAPQRRATAAYYAGLASPSEATGQSPASPQIIERGRVLAVIGDESRQVQSCANCHGPGGVGSNLTFPYLAGQHQDYLQLAMTEWKTGARNTDPSKQMPGIAARLNDDDIAAVAAYYASQTAPPPVVNIERPAVRAQKAAPLKRSKAGGSSGAGAASGVGPAQGTGTEQGAPTSGGSQGPGGGGGTKAGPSGP